MLRAGLWEREVRLADIKNIDLNEVYRIAESQSVIGLVAAGIEHISDVKVPQAEVLQFIGTALQLEQRNQAMNKFIRRLVDQMRTASIYALLLKGQGLAQCYEKPLWRASGDVDLFLSEESYNKAKVFYVRWRLL